MQNDKEWNFKYSNTIICKKLIPKNVLIQFLFHILNDLQKHFINKQKILDNILKNSIKQQLIQWYRNIICNKYSTKKYRRTSF